MWFLEKYNSIKSFSVLTFFSFTCESVKKAKRVCKDLSNSLFVDLDVASQLSTDCRNLDEKNIQNQD